MNIPNNNQKRVVIVGGGFGGVELAKKLSKQSFQVVLFDRNNYFTFQPLLYQVATSGLEANSVVYPFRKFFRKKENVFFWMAEVNKINPELSEIETSIGSLKYDYLVIAAGSKPNFFGLTPDKLFTLKTLGNALDLRNHVLRVFEHALEQENPEILESLINIVIVGGGPTGVELAGAFAEMKNHVLPWDYPQLDLKKMQIHLVEGQDRVLPTMSKVASRKAQKFLEKMGVRVWLNQLVKTFEGKEVQLGEEQIRIHHLIWTAGVQGAKVFGVDNPEGQKSNRLIVDHFNRLVDQPENIFAIGDIAQMKTESFPNGHPMVAPVAIQQAHHLAKNLKSIQQNKSLVPFKYKNKGEMATIGRNRAVVDLPYYRTQGTFAWFIWMFVHIMSLVGFRNKLVTFINWTYNYFTYDRALRLIIKSGK